MEVVEPGNDLLVVTTNGYGKRTPLSEYPAKGRATGGVATLDQKALNKTGLITAARVVKETDDVTLITTGGQILRTSIQDIKRAGRATRGMVIMELQEGDKVASLARISMEDLRQAEEEKDENG
jgi:DNA gyrase subunit A